MIRKGRQPAGWALHSRAKSTKSLDYLLLHSVDPRALAASLEERRVAEIGQKADGCVHRQPHTSERPRRVLGGCWELPVWISKGFAGASGFSQLDGQSEGAVTKSSPEACHGRSDFMLRLLSSDGCFSAIPLWLPAEKLHYPKKTVGLPNFCHPRTGTALTATVGGPIDPALASE